MRKTGLFFGTILTVLLLNYSCAVFSPSSSILEITDSASDLTKDNSKGWGLRFRVTNRWKPLVHFYDFGFDGTLDLVVYYEGTERYEARPKDPEWAEWEKRYLQVREELSKGRL